MSRILCGLSLFGLAAAGFSLVGCSKEQPPVAADEEVVAVEVPELSPSDVTDAMASLSEADRTAALAQKVCPVSGETLGAMGTPVKVTVKGRDVFLCCAGCQEKIEADPDKYLAKLDAK